MSNEANDPGRAAGGEWSGARVARRGAWMSGGSTRAVLMVAFAIGCGGGGAGAPTTEPSRPPPEEARAATVGDELVPPAPPSDLAGAAERPLEPSIPADTTPLTSRMKPTELSIPRTRRGGTERFTFDGFRRGWFARLPAGRQHLLTPVYGEGKVYLGGGFSSHQLFAYDARTGEREWTASAPDGGPSAAILEDGKVLFNTESCTLFAVDAATGRQRWSRWLGDPLMSQPAAANGLVFSGHIVDGQSPGGLTAGTTGFGVGGGRRYGFTALSLATGAPRWSRAISADVMNAAVLDDQDAFFTTMDGVVWRLDQRTGRVRWRRRMNATSAPWLEGDEVHVTVRARESAGEDGARRVVERPTVLSRRSGETLRQHDGVEAAFAASRPDTGVQQGWRYEGSRASIVGGRIYQTIGNEVHCRDAETEELLWRRRYTEDTRARPASPPAVAGSQLVFGTQDGVLFGLDIDTGMTAWAYDVGEPIAAQPSVGHGWVYASTTRGGLVALEVSDASFDGWHMWGGNARHNGRVLATEPPAEDDERPSEGTLALGGEARDDEVAGFPLRGTRVNAQVSGFVARVRVEQTFHNPYDRAVEAVYLFPLPDDAAVDAMEMRVGDRVVRANIRRRRRAQEEYRAARDRGVLASLLEQERPNLFRQSVANIRPGDEVSVTLTYTQALPYEAGSYRFVYPMVAGPRYQPETSPTAPPDDPSPTRQVVLAPGAERPDRVRVEITADLGVALSEVTSPTHELSVERDGDRRARLSLAGPARPDRDLDVRFQVAGAAPTVAVLASPREPDAPAEARGHFSLAIHPRMNVPDDELMPRELVFLVDTSSSMHGRPMAMAKAAMRRALEGLRPSDTFRVLSFSDRASALSDAPLEATPENLARARRFVDAMQALGATEMLRGVRAALEPESDPARLRVVLMMTDGYVGNEAEVFREVDRHLGQARLFGFGVGSAVNRYMLTRLAEVGRGDAQVVTLDESPEEAADAFHERVGRPYLTDVTIDWGDLQVEGAYPRRLPDLFADRPLVVHGRYAAGGESTITIRGRVAGRPFAQEVSVALPSSGAPRPELASVWARTRIRDLMLAMALQPNDELREEVTQLGLSHHLLTQWTAFVAIDEGYRADGAIESEDGAAPGERLRVHQPSGSPAGVTRAAQAQAAPRPDAVVDLLSGAAASGRAGGGYAADLAEEAAPPAPVYRAPARRTASRARPSLAQPARPVDCHALARRPDGTIDRARLEECLRRQRGGAQKTGPREWKAMNRPGRAPAGASAGVEPTLPAPRRRRAGDELGAHEGSG